MIEGRLEVKLPMWRDEKQRWEESEEKRRRRKIKEKKIQTSEKLGSSCGAKHISKSNVENKSGYGAVLDVQMLFCVAGTGKCATCQK